ncbi:hypothetical protein [Calidifontibacillus oryziterrae]|uniref:hypothetical protein n=1 Tax=Calidifontibacillus oryziterrae TaxID=1191699 RepID=UPI0002EE4A4F|nr:hypothetical protein [Calidifontibacillus oryziterrae]
MSEHITSEDYCVRILNENGPILGSHLSKQLQNELKISPVNARKIIQRATNKGIILSTKPVSFRHGQFLYYLPHQNISEVLTNVLKQQRKGLSRVFSSLLHNNGVILRDEAIKIAASITNSDFFPKNQSLDKTLDDLKQLHVISNVVTYNHVSFIKASTRFLNNMDIGFAHYRRHIINRLFTIDAVHWLEQMNLLSWNQTQVFDTTQKRVDFNGHLWDVVGFTYLYGHYETKFENTELTKIPSFVFIEAIFHRQTYLEDVMGFMTRIEMQSARMKNFKTGSRITPILLYIYLNKEAFEFCKANGIMMINSRGWLGEFAPDLFEFLSHPKNDDVVNTCDYYIQRLLDRGFDKSHLMHELLVIKHLNPLIAKGWKSQRHVHYEYDNILYYFDWVMYDSKNTPYICTVIFKDALVEQKIKSFVANEYQTFKKVFKAYFNSDQEVKLMIFDEDGKIHEE